MSFRSLVNVLLVIAAQLLPIQGNAQSQKSEYGIRQDQPTTGSNIPRYEVKGSVLPINKRYAEFTAEEKATLNKLYERVDEGDEPPFPADGLRPIYDAIRKAQATLMVRGELILLATVNAQGQVTEIKTIGSPSKEMTQFVSSLLFITQFKPAVCKGQPCQMQFPFAYNFQMG